MRNLYEHPMTREELINCLRQLLADITQVDRIGDMRPSLVAAAIYLLQGKTPSYFVEKEGDQLPESHL